MADLIFPPANAAKARKIKLHKRAAAVSDRLSPNACRLLDLVLKSHDHHGDKAKIDLPFPVISEALNIPEDAAVSARIELVKAGHLSVHDVGLGRRFFSPRTTIA